MGNFYDASFYREQAVGSLRSARKVVPMIVELVRPRSVVDVGCGVGTWLKAYQEQQVPDVFGFDGQWVNAQRLLIPATNFRSMDLSRPPTAERRYDLAQSLEVAEHIDEQHAPQFVEFLTDLADVVVFSAALPYQGGTNHINERWPSYWRQLFMARGFELYDAFRPRLWNEEDVEWWYAQNLFLYVKSATNSALAERVADSIGFRYPERLVHPGRIDPTRNPPAGVRTVLSKLPQAVEHALRRKLANLRAPAA